MMNFLLFSRSLSPTSIKFQKLRQCIAITFPFDFFLRGPFFRQSNKCFSSSICCNFSRSSVQRYDLSSQSTTAKRYFSKDTSESSDSESSSDSDSGSGFDSDSDSDNEMEYVMNPSNRTDGDFFSKIITTKSLRCDRVVGHALNLSSGNVEKMVWKKQIFLNGDPVIKKGVKVDPGAVIDVTFEDEQKNKRLYVVRVKQTEKAFSITLHQSKILYEAS